MVLKKGLFWNKVQALKIKRKHFKFWNIYIIDKLTKDDLSLDLEREITIFGGYE